MRAGSWLAISVVATLAIVGCGINRVPVTFERPTTQTRSLPSASEPILPPLVNEADAAESDVADDQVLTRQLDDALRVDEVDEAALARRAVVATPPAISQFSADPKPNQAELLVDADRIYPAMLQAIANASRSVKIDYFLLGGDIGMKFADALISRYRAGLDVQVMLDGWAVNSGGPTGKELITVLARLKASGIPLKAYPIEWMPHNPGHFRNRFQIDHNKLLVIDREQAFVGSMNIFDLATMNHDVMVRLRGPIGQEIAGILDEEWRRHRTADTPISVPDGPDVSLVRGTMTGVHQRNTREMLLEAIAHAQKSIHMAIYDFSDVGIAQALGAAQSRGVKVEALIDPHIDTYKYVPMLRFINLYGLPNLSPVSVLLDEHVPVRWFAPSKPQQELHMKLTIFDGNRAMVGSTNYTYQSFNNFRETGVELIGGRVLDQLEAMFDETWQHRTWAAKPLTRKERLFAREAARLENARLGWW